MQGNEGKAFKMLEKDAKGEYDDLDVINYSYIRYVKTLIKNKIVPKTMSPNKEEFEQLGFTFEDIDDNNNLCKATFPEGWELVITDDSYSAKILDDNDLNRGFVYYNNQYGKNASMILESRYDIYSEYINEDCTVKEVYFGNPNEKLFVAGQVDFHEGNYKPEKRIQEHYFEERLKILARQYATTYYPDWHNINAYWDDEKKVRKIEK